MHSITILVAVVIVLSGIYFSQRNKTDVIKSIQEEPEVLSESEEKKENQTTPSAKPTSKPTAITTVPPPQPTSAASNLSEYRYPNSEVVNSSVNSLQLSSNDSTDAITNWYKDKINSLGMSVTSFVTTQANDKVLNKLVGADGQKEIRVEISKENSGSPGQISVTIE